MTEDDILQGVLEAAAYGGWLIHHVRRSDLALQQGTPGWPDVAAAHEQRGLFVMLELKGERGRLSSGQVDWLAALTAAGVDSRVVTPETYDETVAFLLGDRLAKRRRWADHPEHDG